MLRKIGNAAKAVAAVTAVLALVGGFSYSLVSGIVETWVHRNEPVYLIPRAYDPIWRNAGFVPMDLVCYSPARCEPDGKPSPQYFIVLKKYEVLQWGLDPAHEITLKADPYF